MIDYKNVKALDAAIKSVHTSAGKIGPMVHEVLVACAYHAVEHKDASRMTNLMLGLPNSINKRNGVSIWIREYTSLILTKDKAGVQKYLGRQKTYTFDKAGEDNPFYNMPEVEKANNPMSLFELFERVIKTGQKRIKEKKLTAGEATLLTTLEKLIPSKEAPVIVPAAALKVAA